MAVKGEGHEVIKKNSELADDAIVKDPPVRSAAKADRTEHRSRTRRERPVAIDGTDRRGPAEEETGSIEAATPSGIVEAVAATKIAVDHMVKVLAENPVPESRPDLTSDVFVGEAKYTGPVTNEALEAFLGAVHEVIGDKEISVAAARRAGLVAAAATAWEDALGPQFDSAHVRELLSVSKQRVGELLRQHRLIGLQNSNGRWQFPAFQFSDGRPPAPKLAEAFWQLSTRAIDPWSAASWCVSPNSQLDGRTPADVATSDADLVAAIGERDADRLSR